MENSDPDGIAASVRSRQIERRRLAVVAGTLCLAVYVAAFVSLRSRIVSRGVTEAGDGWSLTVYYFAKSPTANGLLTFSFAPLILVTGGRLKATLDYSDVEGFVTDRRPVYPADPTPILEFFN